jgi:inner membrane protein
LFSPLSGRWFHSDSLFIIDAWIWLLFVFSIAISQALEGEGDRHWGRPVQAALAVAFAYICFNIGLSETAVAEVRHRAPNATAIFASPPPFAFWRRDMVWREGRNISIAAYRPFGGGLGPTHALGSDDMDEPIVRTAIHRSKGLRKFLYWSILPVAMVTRSGCKTTVNIGDARYLEPGTRSSRLGREDVIDFC